jgi:hypothetical protein
MYGYAIFIYQGIAGYVTFIYGVLSDLDIEALGIELNVKSPTVYEQKMVRRSHSSCR